MPQFRVSAHVARSTIAQLALAGAVCLGASGSAAAANHVIPAQSSTFECASIKPGDTLTLPAGTRGPLRVRNCTGTQSNPIVIENEANGSGPAIIRRVGGGSGGFVFNCEDCIGVVIDGSNKWRGAPAGKTYGIKITVSGSQAPSAYLRVGGLFRFVTVRNVEIDGVWPAAAKYGSGLRMNDLQVKRSQHAGLWHEGILIEDNYIHDVAQEGMYIGANYADGDLPLRDVEIRNNRVEDTGWDGINTKAMWSGDNRIHHNVVRRAGKNSSMPKKASQYSGIMNLSGTVKIYNNWVESTGQHGIQSWTQTGPKVGERKGPFEAQIWNNVVVGAGALWKPFMQNSFGISVGAQSGCEKPEPSIYSNTIVDSRQSAVNVNNNAATGFVRDNIVAGVRINPAITVPKFINLLNNRVGSVAQIEFVDPSGLNFRLKVGSPARNQGSSTFPSTDFDDIARPKGGSADQGAFEASN